MLRVHRLGLGLSLLLWLGFGAAGCGDDSAGPAGGAKATSFESDLPASSADGHGTNKAGAADASATLGTGERAAAPTAMGPAVGGQATSANSSADADRAIAEADIIQADGDRLYALSRTAGLAVVDVRKPDALALLGRYRELPAQPFEMYLRDGVALVMFSGWGQYVKVEGGDNYQWISTSKLLALDVADPSHISALGSFDIPGSISDSRMVGDIVYVVSHQDGYCWRCEKNKPLSAVVSLDVSNPRQVHEVQKLEFADGNVEWGPRSISVTDKRMYVGGPAYGSDMPTGSTIQVVDISDAKGALVQGASVMVKGQISSRWQMDEYSGVLRVITQMPQWWSPNGVTFMAPTVQTFRVVSSNQLDALGQIELQLPKRETLRSVRFDGTRAYAITAEQKDPLFTIDMSDPAHPRQVGELEMPGFVYHMEPRGERLLGLGFDQNNPAGAITVSLFDVKDLSKPQMLSRVNFGGNWGSLPEDQDRIHKVFRVLDDVGLILVPFSGWSDARSGNGCGYGSYSGGVQIIDFKNDTLKGRGAAGGNGEIRRALLAQGRLLTVSDERVQAFDIDNRDQPQRTSEVVLARNINSAYQLDGNVVARMGWDSYTGQPSLDFVAAEDAGEPNKSYGELDLSQVRGAGKCPKSLSLEQIFVRGSELDILYQSYDIEGRGEQSRGVLVVDASDPKAVHIVSDTHWPNDTNWYTYYGFYNYGAYSLSTPAVRTTHTISMLEQSSEYDGVRSIEHLRLRVIDLRDPANVKFAVLPLSSASNYSGLLAYDDVVYTSHFTGDNTSGKAKFYVDRFDVSDPGALKQLASINVPGSLMSYDPKSGRAITSELRRVITRDVTAQDCYDRFAYAEFVSNETFNNRPVSGGGSAGVSTPAAMPIVDPVKEPIEPPPSPKGTCTGYVQKLNLVHMLDSVAQLDDTLELKEKQQLSSVSMGDGLVFAILGHGGYYGRGLVDVAIADCFGPCGGGYSAPNEPVELLVLGGFGSGKFEQGHIRVDDVRDPWWGFWGTPPVYAYGTHALLIGQSDIAIIDASKPSAPVVARKVPLIASAQSVDVRDKTALLTLGAQGVQWLSLE